MPDAPVLLAGRYRLGEILGRGGMGQVLLARDETLERDVAIKEIDQPLGSDGDASSRRTLREARAAARINHPNVVQVYDVLQLDDRTWIVMEYVPSRSLREEIAEQGPLDPYRVARIGLDLIGALRTAHRLGVEHRDVKPANVLLADDGRVLLTDFGIAAVDDDGVISRSDILVGSPQFMAPERAQNGVSGPEADLWSLGATLYAAIEGRAPYQRGSTMATLTALTTEEPDPPKHTGVLRPLLDGLLRKDPVARMSAEDAESLARSILADLDGEGGPAPAKPSGGLAGFAAAFRIPRPRPSAGPKPSSTAGSAGGDAGRSNAKGKSGKAVGAAGGVRAETNVSGDSDAADSAAADGHGGVTGVPEASAAEIGTSGGAAGIGTSDGAAGIGTSDGAAGIGISGGVSGTDAGGQAVADAGGERDHGSGGGPGGNVPGGAGAASVLAEQSLGTSSGGDGKAAAPDLGADRAAAGDAGALGGPAASGERHEVAAGSAAVAGVSDSAEAPGGNGSGGGSDAGDGSRTAGAATRIDVEAARAGRPAALGLGVVPEPERPRAATERGRPQRAMLIGGVSLALVLAAGTAWAVSSGSGDPETEAKPAATTSAGTAADPQAPAGPDAAQAPQPGGPSAGGTSAGAQPGASAAPGAGPSRSAPAPGGGRPELPAGWKEYKDKTGFSVYVPASWKRSQNGTIVYFRGDNKILGIDQTDQPKSNPVKDWQSQSEYRVSRGDFPNYRQIKIAAVDYFRKAADWEFTFTRDGTRRHTNNRGAVVADDKAYGFYWETNDEVWADSRRDLELVFDSFQPAK